jgi:GH25 family lysozyme M1 (1,4-beta-N-acetylmuramidase)
MKKDDYEDDYDEYPEEDYEAKDGRNRSRTLYLMFGVSAFILMILLVTLMLNGGDQGGEPHTGNTLAQEQTTTQDTSSDVTGISESGLRSQDLSFWDMAESTEASSATRPEGGAAGATVPDDKQKLPSEPDGDTVSGNSSSGDKDSTQVTHADGTTEWVNINKALKKNSYSETGFQKENGIMHYYENGRDISYAGVDISKNSGTVDFEALKKSGISFVMIKLGSRGYDTGKVTLDSSFVTNIQGAEAAGLGVGIYFYSQAVSEAEATEEVNFILQNLKGYTITYPVVMDMELVANDTARTDKLSAADKTRVAATFMSGVQAAGYIPAVYGNKEWLLTKINLQSIGQSKVWLSQPGDIPDYPYQFVMWQYSTGGKVNGISGNADLDISMIDFSAR